MLLSGCMTELRNVRALLCIDICFSGVNRKGSRTMR
jgi:hypothetical protein